MKATITYEGTFYGVMPRYVPIVGRVYTVWIRGCEWHEWRGIYHPINFLYHTN